MGNKRRGSFLIWVIVLAAIVAVGVLAWIRFAPTDQTRWHVDPMVTVDQDYANGVRRKLPLEDGLFERLHTIILETPRTELLFGSVGSGHVTYVTRSQAMGFPDYATLQIKDGTLEIWSRSRFGTSDSGVNKARVEGWINALGQK